MLERAFLPGIIGTIVMTIYVYTLAWLANRNWRVVHVLLAILRRRSYTRSAHNLRLASAAALHSAIGVIFAMIYDWLLQRGFIQANIQSATVYGLLTGMLAMLVWRLVFVFRYEPPDVQPGSYSLVVGSAHIPFSIAMMLVW